MADTINNVKNTFTSWDTCMSKAYCKWPVIAGIVIGSLIILSVVICVARCICCGAECVCCCFKCCSGCCGSGRRDKGHQQLHSAPPTPYGGPPGGLPFYNQQYRSAPQPVYHNNNMGGGYAQTATFEGKVHEDSLPAMPSWESAQERRVEIVEDAKPNAAGAGEAHELEKLSPTGQSASSPPLAGYAAPSQPQRAMGGSAAHSPYGGERDPFLQGGQTSGVMHGDSHTGYRGASPQPQHGAQAVGLGYANHRPGGLQHSQPSYNSPYQDSQSDFYAQGGGYGDQRPRAHDRQYSQQSRPGYDRQYSEQTLPAYDDNRHYAQQPQRHDDGYGQQSRHDQGYHQQDNVGSQYTGSAAYDPRQPGYDQDQGAYRAFSPAPTYTTNPRKPVNGSWREV